MVGGADVRIKLIGMASAITCAYVVMGGACGGGRASEPPDGGSPSPPAAFLRARGRQIVDGDGNPVFLKGVSLGNEVWTNAVLPADHAEVDFIRLAEMGANSTRFLLNYRTFEDVSASSMYREGGWAWVDQNISWAKAHGIRLLLNMHVPQGGFQSNGEGGALWADIQNQDRLTALWKEIARRYANEPIIVGFGLLNEPEPLVSRQQWHDLAIRIATAIRAVDASHILFVERPIAVAGNFNSDADMNLFTIDDPNVVYEFHFYDPNDYTFQLQPWNNSPDGGNYPDPSKIGGITEQWINLATFDAPVAPAGTSDWTHYEGTRITATGSTIAAGKPTLVGQALGVGSVAFDDLSINEYDAAGTFLREVEHIYPASSSGWYFWSSNAVGSGTTTAVCKTSATCLSISGTSADASWGGYGFYFAPTAGHQYSISGWMKGTNLPAGAIARMRVDLIGSSTPVRVRDKAGLADMMAPYLAWGAAHDVPLFLGEFGVYRACFGGGKGGLTWVDDVYHLATGGGAADSPQVAGLSYHQYHEDAFALYYGSGPVDPANANQPLIDLLTARLHAAP
jgi:endoglucanase